jgi:hypothetical protein
MFRRKVFVVLVGCGSSQLQVRMGEPSNVDSHDDAWVLGACAPTTHVTVTDQNGTPLVGALVAVRQLEHAMCPSVGPSTATFATVPVRTDRHGVATTCDPDNFYKDKSAICPHHRDPAMVVVLAGDRAAQLQPPFAAELRAVLVPCADLLARDPGFPCPREPPK